MTAEKRPICGVTIGKKLAKLNRDELGLPHTRFIPIGRGGERFIMRMQRGAYLRATEAKRRRASCSLARIDRGTAMNPVTEYMDRAVEELRTSKYLVLAEELKPGDRLDFYGDVIAVEPRGEEVVVFTADQRLPYKRGEKALLAF